MTLAERRAAVGDPLSQPSEAEFRRVAGEIARWAARDFATLSDRPIGLTGTPDELSRRLPAAPPDAGRGFADVFTDAQENIFPFAFRCNHPRFLAFVPPWPSAESVWGEWLTAATNFFAGNWHEGSGPAHVERTVLGWFRDWLGLPESTEGVLTAGGSEANLTALVVAREPLTADERGRAVIYLSAERHWSVDRALRVMGHAPDRVRHLPTDAHFRFDVGALRDAVARDRRAGLRPWLVVGTAGATNTGTVDPLNDLAAVAAREGLWFHVDAAYGWSGVLDADERPAFAGIGRADSVTLDPHKWFAQPYESGCLLVRDGPRLAAPFADRPDYLHDTAPRVGEVNYSDHGISLSRRFRAFKIWFAVQSLGVDWHRRLVTRCCRLATYAEAALRAAGFEILSPRQLGVVCFRHRRPGVAADWDAVNKRMLDELRDAGIGSLSSTRLHGAAAIRMCFVNGRTTCADVDGLIGFLKGAAEAFTKSPV